MRKLLVVPVVLALSACGSKAQIQKYQSNPQVKKDTTEAQQIVQSCLTKGDLLTHDGRKVILQCMAPPGHKAAFQRCATQDLAHNGVITAGQRQRLAQGLATCVEKNR